MSIRSMTLSRRATDAGEPSNREILDRIDDLDRRLGEYTAEHKRDHANLSEWRVGVDVGSALRQQQLNTLVPTQAEVALLHDFRVQVVTIGASVKWILGGSLVAAVAAILSVVVTFAHIIQSTTP